MNEWNVDDYYNQTEPHHQWDLRRQFMIENKDRFPEDRIVCLAQTLINMEFLGCRYPQPTMDLINDLSVGIIEPFRERFKGRLQRTFVSGSDAANSKVNKKQVHKNPCNNKVINLIETDVLSSSKVLPVIQEEDVLSNFILIYAEGGSESASSILNRSAAFCKLPITFTYSSCVNPDLPPPGKRKFQREKGNNNKSSDGDKNWTCSILMNGEHVCTDDGPTKAKAKSQVSDQCLELLKEKCYSIKIKNAYCSKDGTIIETNQISSLKNESSNSDQPQEASLEIPISSSNVGHKLLKMMGWSGSGGLKKDSDENATPITPSSLLGGGGASRKGLGSSDDGLSLSFRTNIRKMLRHYVDGEESGVSSCNRSMYDLVFSKEFSHAQREFIHKQASIFGLKSKSYGTEENRFITISHKFNTRQFINQLVRDGGSNDKYELLHPLDHHHHHHHVHAP